MRLSPIRLTRRLLAGLACICALLSGLFAEGLHVSLSAHHYCAEHQTLEHGDEVAVLGSGPGESSVRAAALHLTSTSENSGHDECGLPPLSREDGFTLTAPDRQSVPWRHVLGVLRPVALEPVSSIPRYRIAPKQSPPVG